MTIHLDNIRLKAYHGIYDHERQYGNNFSVDVSFDIDAERSAISDDIADTVNYETVYKIVKDEMSFAANLLENVAYRIHKSIKKEFPAIDRLRVAVSKYDPFADGNVDRVTVSVADE